jgi:hypothetical protein
VFAPEAVGPPNVAPLLTTCGPDALPLLGVPVPELLPVGEEV